MLRERQILPHHPIIHTSVTSGLPSKPDLSLCQESAEILTRRQFVFSASDHGKTDILTRCLIRHPFLVNMVRATLQRKESLVGLVYPGPPFKDFLTRNRRVI